MARSFFQLKFISLLLFSSPVHSWLATEYVQVIYTVNEIGTYSNTVTVFPTGPVTPLSSSTDSNNLDDLTVVALMLSGTDLPVSTPSRGASILNIYGPPLFTGVSSVFFAPITITQPPTCAHTTFSYSMCWKASICSINANSAQAQIYPSFHQRSCSIHQIAFQLLPLQLMKLLSVHLSH